MNRFYIAALPRSGTAWLSTFLSHGDVSFCFHERHYSAFYDDIPDVEFLGDASSSLCGFERDDFDGPLIVIDRPFFDAMSAVSACPKATRQPNFQWRSPKDLDIIESAFSLTKDAADFIVPYEDMFTEPALEAVWDQCIPGHDFPRHRFLALQNLNVQLHEWPDYANLTPNQLSEPWVQS